MWTFLILLVLESNELNGKKLEYSPISSTDHSQPKIVNEKYQNKDKKLQIEFIDISGELETYIDFEVEVIADSFGFLEGPVWVNGNVLFSEPKTESIWKYNPSKNTIELFHKYSGCGATGLAYSSSYPNELWIACMFGNKIMQINISDFNILNEYNHKTYHIERDAKFEPNDIDIDKNGNIYFTDLPISRNNEIGARGGVYHIKRNTKKMRLIQLVEYGPNGISINNDESMMVISNTIDVPIEDFDFYNFQQYDWSKHFIRGFKNKNSNGLLDEPFDYFKTDKEPYFSYMLHNKYDMLFDNNGFDMYNNLWQTVFFNFQTEGGQISILRNDGQSSKDVKYIGTIRIKNIIYAASDVQQGLDGYIYATCGSFDKNEGSLVRYKLKQLNKQEL
eukprot:447086_1